MSQAEASAKRHAEILGDGPRIAPMTVDECPSGIIELAQSMMRNASNRKPVESIDDVPEYFKTMLKHPDLCAVHSELGMFLMAQGSIERRHRELAILRVAWILQAPYEWGEHVFIGKRFGLDTDDFERIKLGSAADGWTEVEAAILRAVEELLDDAMISDATWDILVRHFDQKQLIELPALIGQYQGVAFLQNALRLRLHNGNLGLAAS